MLFLAGCGFCALHCGQHRQYLYSFVVLLISLIYVTEVTQHYLISTHISDATYTVYPGRPAVTQNKYSTVIILCIPTGISILHLYPTITTGPTCLGLTKRTYLSSSRLKHQSIKCYNTLCIYLWLT